MAIKVGLTGGIGSGKSTVSKLLAQRGAVIVDADQVARDLQSGNSPMVAAMVAEFGDGIVDADGDLDRSAVADLVFGDTDDAKRNLALLNEITHPAIHDEIERQMGAADARSEVVVLDHPLLAERPREGLDFVVVVDVPVDVQVERLSGRGMTEHAARKRIASQATRDERLAIAQFVIDNSGPVASLEPQIDALWAELLLLG